MKNKKAIIVLFLFIQFLLAFFYKWDNLSYFFLAECFFFYLILDDIVPFIVVLLYFWIDLSAAFTTVFFLLLFHFLKKKIKIQVKLSIILFLVLYFFTARYETYLIKAVMPGFIAFVALIYAITRMPAIQENLSKAVFLYTVAGFLYSILFNLSPYFSYQPFLMFSIDIIQLIIALSIYNSFNSLLEE